MTEAPGAAFDYSDLNMALLFDTLVEKVFQVGSRQANSEVLRPRITAPLDCKDRPAFSDAEVAMRNLVDKECGRPVCQLLDDRRATNSRPMPTT